LTGFFHFSSNSSLAVSRNSLTAAIRKEEKEEDRKDYFFSQLIMDNNEDPPKSNRLIKITAPTWHCNKPTF